MKRMMSVTVSTKRRPSVSSDGKQSAPTTFLTSLKVTPIDPLNTDEFHNIIIRYKIENPHRLYGCYCASNEDVRIGDVIVWDNREFNLKGCGDWIINGSHLYEMILEELVNV
jgi:hypothetical protein